MIEDSPPPEEPSGSNIQVGNSNDDNETPTPGSERWYDLGHPGLIVNGDFNRNVSQLLDPPLSVARIPDRLISVPESEREPEAISGMFCSKTYLNGIPCIAQVSRVRGICEFHREGKLRVVRCT